MPHSVCAEEIADLEALAAPRSRLIGAGAQLGADAAAGVGGPKRRSGLSARS